MMNLLIEKLHSEKCSCVIACGNKIHTFSRRGIADLFITLKNAPELLAGALIADKVVGKAAAALMVIGRVRQVYADVISTPAIDMLRTHGIEVSFATETDYIINRAGTGLCPMEQLSRDENNPEAIRSKVEEFLRGMSTTCEINRMNTEARNITE